MKSSLTVHTSPVQVKTVINETRPSHEYSLSLNVGNHFHATLFKTFYGGEKIVDALNQMGQLYAKLRMSNFY